MFERARCHPGRVAHSCSWGPSPNDERGEGDENTRLQPSIYTQRDPKKNKKKKLAGSGSAKLRSTVARRGWGWAARVLWLGRGWYSRSLPAVMLSEREKRRI